MNLLEMLAARSTNPDEPFIAGAKGLISHSQLADLPSAVSDAGAGDVVALVGELDAKNIRALLDLIDKKAIIAPLSPSTAAQHDYFLEAMSANVIISNGRAKRISGSMSKNPLLKKLRERETPGLILFSSGSTGKPKAILHDFSKFLARYRTPRPAWTTLNFLLFDHIGGLNTLFHTMFNGGRIIVPSGRDPQSIVKDIQNFNVELLPATPTFIRLWSLAGIPEHREIPSLRLITYGTERMDQHTLSMLANALPEVDIRQTYGMSEMGILRVSTRKRDELWIRVGGEGIETRVVDGELWLRSQTPMLGYLNAPSPFDNEGWYHSGDMVEEDGEWLRLSGRKDFIINVGGQKVFPAEVEHAALCFPGVGLAKAVGVNNPITGMHVELFCEINGETADFMPRLKKHLAESLPAYARPLRIKTGGIAISPRFKQL